MMVLRLTLTLSAMAGLVQCKGDESVAAYGGADAVWELQELDGQSFPAGTTLTFPAPGKISGSAPCNSYFGEQTAPYPWFKVEKLGSTKMACPDLAKEQEFLQALTDSNLSEVAGNTLILSNDNGQELVFTAQQ